MHTPRREWLRSASPETRVLRAAVGRVLDDPVLLVPRRHGARVEPAPRRPSGLTEVVHVDLDG